MRRASEIRTPREAPLDRKLIRQEEEGGKLLGPNWEIAGGNRIRT